MAPLCGGYFVKRLNRATTLCADGAHAYECYVTELDLATLKLSPSEQGDTVANVDAELFRGKIAKLTWNGKLLGRFVASEAWRNASSGSVASGTYYRVDPNPIRCITYPCPAQYHEAKLNSTVSTTLVGFAGPHAAKLASALSGSESVLAAGTNQAGKGGKVLDATQFWTRIRASETFCSSDADCTLSRYTHLISSSAECYCALCPNQPMNLASDELYRLNWEQYCSGVPLMCPMVKCMAPKSACVNSTCVKL
jgi:hypothetical protein